MNNPELGQELDSATEAMFVYEQFLEKMDEKHHAEEIHDNDTVKLLKEQCDELFVRALELDPEIFVNGHISKKEIDSILKDYSDKLTRDLHAKG